MCQKYRSFCPFVFPITFALVMVLTGVVLAIDHPGVYPTMSGTRPWHSNGTTPTGGPQPHKVQVDSIHVLGGPGQLSGKFQDAQGFSPDPQGWTGVDLTAPPGETGCGDFSQVWPMLFEIDPCFVNFTPQFAFIDDGFVVPGTGGSMCITWCYGPGGYVVNHTGGLLGDNFYVRNEIWSPVLELPGSGYNGALLAYDIFRHAFLSSSYSGIFDVWHVRSTSSADPADIEQSDWQDRGYVYWGGPNYLRDEHDVSDLLEPGAQHIQIALGIHDLGWYWGFEGDDGTPAPFFDNVAFIAYETNGPRIVADERHLAQDSFPASGLLDLTELGNNSIRFDMARNIALYTHGHNDPGDSLVADIRALRPGAQLVENPRLVYELRPNPLFNPHRNSGLPNAGFVLGDSARNSQGEVIDYRWTFDLPDSGFLYPGDVLHYYLEAQSDAGGDVKTSRLPADTTGFGLFPGERDFVPSQYPRPFAMNGLPSLDSDLPGDQPGYLLWNDGADAGLRWEEVLDDWNQREGVHYDLYTTNEPSTGVGNGLGGRATTAQLAGYRSVLYTCANLSQFTLSNGDAAIDASQDLAVLDGWLGSGDKNMFLTGDDLAASLLEQGAMGQAFLADWLGLTFHQDDLRPLIDNQSAPLVVMMPDNPVFAPDRDWVAYGGCVDINRFDAVEPLGGATRLAEFTDPVGNPGAYPYAAATLNQAGQETCRLISMPFDFQYIYDWRGGDKTGARVTGRQLSIRHWLLFDVLNYFGHIIIVDVAEEPPPRNFSVSNHPNPFNPRTEISYFMPAGGHLTIRLYDVRGALVRTLWDGAVPAGNGKLTWDGTDNEGRAAASGVYFYQAEALGEQTLGKMTLVR